MSYELDVFGGGGALLPREARRAARALSRVQVTGLVRQANIDADIDAAEAKIEGLTMVTGHGMTAVTRVAQGEMALTQNVPGASGRVAYLGERHMFAVGDVLDDLRRDLRRR